MNRPDYIVDIQGISKPARTGSSGNTRPAAQPRPWLAMQWRCCGAYSRIYRNRSGTAYEGNCPKCAKPVRIKIASGGTSHRFFEAG